MINCRMSDNNWPDQRGRAVALSAGLFNGDMSRLLGMRDDVGWKFDFHSTQKVTVRKNGDIGYLNLETGDFKPVAKGDVESFFFENANIEYYSPRINRDEKEAETTEVYDRNGKIVFESKDEYLGSVYSYDDGYFCFVSRKKSAVDRVSGNVLWQKRLQATVLPFNNHAYFLVRDNYTETVTKYDYRTGEPISSIEIPTGLGGLKIENGQASFYGKTKDGRLVASTLDIENENLVAREVVDLGDSHKEFDIRFGPDEGKGLIYLERRYQDSRTYQQPPDSVRRYCFETGKFMGEIVFPDDLRLQGFSILDGYYSASCRTRELIHGEPARLFIWDEDEWTKPSEIINAPEIVETKRQEESDDTASYRVSLTSKGEGTFDVFCQVSAELFRAGAQAGICLVDEDKERDVDFNGKIICDVSALELNDLEKRGIESICKSTAEELHTYYFRPSIDPAEKITVEPVFGE